MVQQRLCAACPVATHLWRVDGTPGERTAGVVLKTVLRLPARAMLQHKAGQRRIAPEDRMVQRRALPVAAQRVDGPAQAHHQPHGITAVRLRGQLGQQALMGGRQALHQAGLRGQQCARLGFVALRAGRDKTLVGGRLCHAQHATQKSRHIQQAVAQRLQVRGRAFGRAHLWICPCGDQRLHMRQRPAAAQRP